MSRLIDRCRLPLERAVSAFHKLVGVKVAPTTATQGQAVCATQGNSAITLPETLFIHRSQKTLASVKQTKDAMYFSTSSGRIELKMTKSQAKTAFHRGKCERDVLALSKNPEIRRQLDKIDPEVLREELREYGAWDAGQLESHTDNLQRILWIAAGDIIEEANK